MALGDYECGEGPCGFDPVVSSDPRAPARAPAAAEFDGATRDFPRDSSGNFRALHPIDQGVALALSVKRGSIRSAPAVGNTIHELDRRDSSRIEQQVTARVNDAYPLSVFLADKSVTTLKIEWEVTYLGAIHVAYTYTNNRTGRTPDPVRVDYGD